MHEADPEAEILLQQRAEPGRALIVGMSTNPAFDPLLMVGDWRRGGGREDRCGRGLGRK